MVFQHIVPPAIPDRADGDGHAGDGTATRVPRAVARDGWKNFRVSSDRVPSCRAVEEDHADRLE